MPSEPALLPLAESVADGAAIDWDAAEARATGDDRAVVRQLRVLAELALLHRSLPAQPGGRPLPRELRRGVAAPAVGSWGHLSLVERLGRGTFGEVYRAFDRQLEREVALKLLHAGASLDDPEASRSLREGRLLARIRHPNVVAVYGADAHDGRVGLWMELISGATLEELLLKRGPFSAREAALVGIDLCRALAAIHAAGLVHRDVKAQNVMREEGGRIVLMDLGTGREVEPGTGAGAGDLAGTPLYLAPEILAGVPSSVRSDLYSLGVLLYHLVTGAYPVRAMTLAELRDGHAKGKQVRLRDARADLPTAFVRVVDRAIAPDPGRRYDSAGEMEADLARALDAKPAPARLSRRTGALAAAVVLMAALAAFVWPMLGGRRTGGSASGPIRSIAVLPLANLSGDPAQEYFSDGMTDELIATLGRLHDLNVISRTSVMQFKGSNRPLPEIAQALGVDAVLEGSVLLLPGSRADAPAGAGPQRVRINARLIHAGAETQVWNKTFETVVADVLTLQSEVAKAVADGIGLRLASQQQPVGSGEPTGRLAQDVEAFDLYLRGRYYWNMRSEEGLKRSVQYFREAIDRDPGYAAAHAGLADAYSLLGVYGLIPRAGAYERASQAASKALQLDKSLGEAHASLGLIQHQRLEWNAAEASFKRALELKPGYASGHHWYAAYLIQRGRVPEATNEINRALTLDPLSSSVNGEVGVILLLARRYDDAVTQLERTLRMDPGFGRARLVLAEAYAHKGLYDRALAEMDKVGAPNSRGSVEIRADIGYILAAAGRRDEALKVAGELADRYQRNEEGAAGGVAVVYAGLRDVDRAISWLERARDRRDPVVGDLKVDPRFDSVRGDSRFDRLLTSIGLVP